MKSKTVDIHMLKWFTAILNVNLSPTSLLKHNEGAIFEWCS